MQGRDRPLPPNLPEAQHEATMPIGLELQPALKAFSTRGLATSRHLAMDRTAWSLGLISSFFLPRKAYSFGFEKALQRQDLQVQGISNCIDVAWLIISLSISSDDAYRYDQPCDI